MAASLSVASHRAAGGSLPDPGATILVIAILGVTGTMLAAHRRGTAVILSALGLSQAALHLFLQFTAAHQAGPQHHGMPFDSTAMLLGHTVAALLTGLMLARAENAVFALARALGLVLPRKSPTRTVIDRPKPAIRRREPLRPLAQLVYQRIHTLRGPPVGSC